MRQPALPALSEHVNDQWQQQRQLLEAAHAVGSGEEFTVDGVTWPTGGLPVRGARHPVTVRSGETATDDRP
ncbi:hypothetical protein OG599_00250 [Streptomyces sp. NBC_01335]|uniref:hypothetical protein n=1 Tax=Streptomyces sp. NBC_01335 TaxID=2903828 RepID=UPI002E1466AB|nr:hypothetical protein OG599_00250 [Streptomyces sp. NBC_01335]